jgi:hypothetical protein
VSDPGPEPPPPPPNLAPPPGYVGFTGSSPERVASIVRLRTFVLVALGLYAIVVVYQMATTPGIVDTSRDFLAGRIDEAQYTDEIAPGAASALLQLPFLATIVLSMVWLHHLVRSNIESGRRGTWAPGWAIGGWFLPPLVLYIIPMLVLRETWQLSDPQRPGGDGWKRSSVHPVLWIWWVLYGIAPAVFIGLSVAGVLRNQFTGIGGDERDAAQAIVDYAGLVYVQSAVTLCAAAAWAGLVWLWTARHVRFLAG